MCINIYKDYGYNVVGNTVGNTPRGCYVGFVNGSVLTHSHQA